MVNKIQIKINIKKYFFYYIELSTRLHIWLLLIASLALHGSPYTPLCSLVAVGRPFGLLMLLLPPLTSSYICSACYVLRIYVYTDVLFIIYVKIFSAQNPLLSLAIWLFPLLQALVSWGIVGWEWEKIAYSICMLRQRNPYSDKWSAYHVQPTVLSLTVLVIRFITLSTSTALPHMIRSKWFSWSYFLKIVCISRLTLLLVLILVTW